MQKTMGRRIREARCKRGITQDTLAELAGLTRTSVNFYESDKHDPSFFNATCIADVLGVSLDWLAGRKEDMRI